MNFRVRTLIKFFLELIVFTSVFALFLDNIWIGIGIGLFLSIALVYDPKIYNREKKKFENKQNQNLESNNSN